MSPEKRLILDNLRSTHNVGSIFRTADGAGVQHIYLGGTTPDPIDRFGRIQPAIAKTALGATESVTWEHVGGADTLATQELLAMVRQLQADGFAVVAVEQAPGSVALPEFRAPDRVVYILGAEVAGVQPELVAAADQVVEIPMAGMKESLNVSVTAGIILFH